MERTPQTEPTEATAPMPLLRPMRPDALLNRSAPPLPQEPLPLKEEDEPFASIYPPNEEPEAFPDMPTASRLVVREPEAPVKWPSTPMPELREELPPPNEQEASFFQPAPITMGEEPDFSPQEEGAASILEETAPFTRPAEETSPGEIPYVAALEEEDLDEDGQDAVPTEQMPQPIPVPLATLNFSKRKKRRWPFLLALVCLVGAVAGVLWQTGAYEQLRQALPFQKDVQSASQHTEPLVYQVLLDKPQATHPTTLSFSVECAEQVPNVRLMMGQGEAPSRKTCAPSSRGNLWIFEMEFIAPYQGQVSVELLDETGAWIDTGHTLAINVE